MRISGVFFKCPGYPLALVGEFYPSGKYPGRWIVILGYIHIGDLLDGLL
jgi:hypothetical protein